jgi:hypothetical protein
MRIISARSESALGIGIFNGTAFGHQRLSACPLKRLCLDQSPTLPPSSLVMMMVAERARVPAP